MSFFLQALRMEFRELLRQRRTLVLLALVPLCVLGLNRLLPPEEALPAVPVGWAMPENCRRGEELLGLLRSREGLVEFIPTDEETLRENVAAGKWECGFVLRPDFDNRVEQQRWSRLFTLVRSESSTVHALVSEAVSSAMLTLTAEEIGAAYLEQAGVLAPESGWELDAALRLEILPASQGQLGLESVSTGLGRNALRGAAAILLTVLSLAMGDALAQSRRAEHRRRLAAVRGPWALRLPALSCRLLVLFLPAYLSLLACGQNGQFLPILALCLRLTALMGLLSLLPGGWSAPVLPFVPPVLLVLCPVLFDAGALLPGMRWLCALPGAGAYLRGKVLANLGACVLYAAAAWLLICFRQHRLNKT